MNKPELIEILKRVTPADDWYCSSCNKYMSESEAKYPENCPDCGNKVIQAIDQISKEIDRLPEHKTLRYFGLRAMQQINMLRAYDGNDIPIGDARESFDLLRDITEAVLSEPERSFGANHRDEIEELKKTI